MGMAMSRKKSGAQDFGNVGQEFAAVEYPQHGQGPYRKQDGETNQPMTAKDMVRTQAVCKAFCSHAHGVCPRRPQILAVGLASVKDVDIGSRADEDGAEK